MCNLCRSKRWCKRNNDVTKMAERNVFFYQCGDCRKFFHNLDVFNTHRCNVEDHGSGDPIATMTVIPRKDLPQKIVTSDAADSDHEDRRQTMTECSECGSWCTAEAYSRHICSKSKSSHAEVSKSEATTSRQPNEDATDVLGDIKISADRWVKEPTLLLIAEYKTRHHKVEEGKITKKHMWDDISNEMKSKGYTFSPEQVSGRWKSLLRGYKNIKDEKKKSGNGKKVFEFETQLDDLYGNDPSIKPVATASSRSKEIQINRDNDGSDSEQSSEKVVSPSTCKRRKSSAVVDVLEKFIDKQEQKQKDEIDRKERMHQEKMEAIRSLVNIIAKTQDK